jgi:antitoxin (DNA-binding transcriptional repressor) of toxin-antitoxin stability system
MVVTGDYNEDVKSVGIKQLKARLSEYVRMARRGELILVSDRDEVVAQLGPVRHRPVEPGSVDDVLERLAQQGQLTRAGQPKPGWTWSPRAVGLSRSTVTRLLDELRSDR